MKTQHLLTFVTAAALSSTTLADKSTEFTPTDILAPFLEQFLADWDEHWKPSDAMKKDVAEGAADSDELYRYRGEWAVEEALKNALKGDKGLVVKTQAAHHAISVPFKKTFDPAQGGLVFQYDLKLQEELQCGGAYMKLLTDSKDGIKYKEFDDKTPYTVMFGPDKCGSTNKVHFIFRHKNPKTGEYEEKHLKNPPVPKSDTLTNLYTLAVYPGNNSYAIYINKEQSKSGSLLEDFDPPVNPPKEIDDPEDKKPEDWVDEARIPDPDAKKPEDWDEDAPRMIPDEDATMPSDWLPDEPAMVSDPSAEKPEDWDDEEDGEWTAPQVANPKCASVSGCGEWKRPDKPNPAYKGKWYPPLIDNPDYKGPWAPKKIPNPNYYEDKEPGKLNKLMGIGIELWTMQNNIMFDNIYVGHSLADAFKLADQTWTKKRAIEDAKEKEEKAKEEEEAKKIDETTGATDEKTEGPAFDINKIIKTAQTFIEKLSQDPVQAVKKFPAYAGALLLLLLAPLVLLSAAGKSKEVEYVKKGDAKKSSKKVKEEVEEEEEEEEEEDADDEGEPKLRKRKPTNKGN